MPENNSYLNISLLSDRFSLIRSKGNVISALASRELIQPFNLEWFRENGAVQNGYSEILADLFARVGGEIKKVGVTITSDMALIKRVPIALGMSENMIDSQLKWEADQLIVSGAEEFILDYHRLPVPTIEGNPQYLMILIRQIVIKELQKLFKSIGMSIEDIDIDIFAVIRALQYNSNISDEKLIIIADIRRDYLVLTVIQRNEYLLSHRVNFDQIQTKSSLSVENDIAALIVKELKRLIFGHRLGMDISAIDALYLTGNEEIEEIKNELMSSESLAVEILDPFSRFETDNSNVNLQAPLMYSAAVGMALKKNPNQVS